MFLICHQIASNIIIVFIKFAIYFLLLFLWNTVQLSEAISLKYCSNFFVTFVYVNETKLILIKKREQAALCSRFMRYVQTKEKLKFRCQVILLTNFKMNAICDEKIASKNCTFQTFDSELEVSNSLKKHSSRSFFLTKGLLFPWSQMQRKKRDCPRPEKFFWKPRDWSKSLRKAEA